MTIIAMTAIPKTHPMKKAPMGRTNLESLVGSGDKVG